LFKNSSTEQLLDKAINNQEAHARLPFGSHETNHMDRQARTRDTVSFKTRVERWRTHAVVAAGGGRRGKDDKDIGPVGATDL
jgi:hypothetical protein